MSIPVHIHQDNGHFVATLVGEPDVTAKSATKSGVIAEMQALLDKRFSQGELIFLDVPKKGVLSFAGKYRDDPTIAEIREEIYRQRDAEPKE
jgi:hypothetical protein